VIRARAGLDNGTLIRLIDLSQASQPLGLSVPSAGN